MAVGHQEDLKLAALTVPAFIVDTGSAVVLAMNDRFEKAFCAGPGAPLPLADLRQLLGVSAGDLEDALLAVSPGELRVRRVALGSHEEGVAHICALGLDSGHAGQVLAMIPAIMEIRAEQSDPELALKLKAFLESSFDALWELDPQTDYYETYTAQADAILGLRPGVFPRRLQAWLERIHPADREAFQDGTKRALAENGRPVSQVYRVRRADGSWAIVEDRWMIVPSGPNRAPHMIGATRDVTIEREAAFAVQRSEALYRALFSTTTNPAFQFTTDLHLVDANPAAVEFFGVTNGGLTGQPLAALIGESSAATVAAHATSQRASTVELVTRKDGDPRHLLLTVVPCSIDEDRTVFGIGVDITEQRNLSAALKESQQELRAQAQSLEDANTALRIVLEQADRGRRELEMNVAENVDTLVLPLLQRLERSLRGRPEAAHVNAIAATLAELARPLRRQFLEGLDVSEPLTPRESEILHLIRRGLTTEQIAESLYLSARTVAFHRNNLRRKLGLHGVRQRLRTHLSMTADHDRSAAAAHAKSGSQWARRRPESAGSQSGR